MCTKILLQIRLFGEIIAELAIYYVDMKNIKHTGLCNSTIQKKVHNLETQTQNSLEIRK